MYNPDMFSGPFKKLQRLGALVALPTLTSMPQHPLKRYSYPTIDLCAEIHVVMAIYRDNDPVSGVQLCGVLLS